MCVAGPAVSAACSWPYPRGAAGCLLHICAEPLSGQTQQLGRGRHVEKSRVDVLVAEERRQIGQLRLRVDSGARPLQYPMVDKGMSQIMNARPTLALRW